MLLLELLPPHHRKVQSALEQLLRWLHEGGRTSQLLRELKVYRTALVESRACDKASVDTNADAAKSDTAARAEAHWRWLCEHVTLLVAASDLRGAQAACEAEFERLVESHASDSYVHQLAAGLARIYRVQGKNRQLQALRSRLLTLRLDSRDTSEALESNDTELVDLVAHFPSQLFKGVLLRRHASQPAVFEEKAPFSALQRAITMPVIRA